MAEERLVVPRVVPQALLVSLERARVVLLDMLDLAKRKVEGRPQVLNILPECRQVAVLGACLVLDEL